MIWFDKYARDYPWRKTDNWFHLLVAEMMLRRTRSNQVVSIYESFTDKYKTPDDAASLTPTDLRTILKSLGLEWRASQLHDTIAYLKDNYSKRSPTKSDDLKKIPGVGDYSSAMIRNRLFNEPLAAVDSNIARIFCRLSGRPFHAESRRNKLIIEMANRFVGGNRSRDINLALIDHAALICKPIKPACQSCPLSHWCNFYNAND